jgi:hypothetical protein
MFNREFMIGKPVLLALILAGSADCVSERLIEAALEKSTTLSQKGSDIEQVGFTIQAAVAVAKQETDESEDYLIAVSSFKHAIH